LAEEKEESTAYARGRQLHTKKVDERKQENFARDVEKTFDKDSEGQ